MRKMYLVIFFSIIAIWLRIMLAKSGHLDSIVAFVNCIALAYLIIRFLQSVLECKRSRIMNSSLPQKTKEARVRIINIFCIIIISFVVFFGALYSIMYASSICNDVLSILALTISFIINDVVYEMKN